MADPTAAIPESGELRPVDLDPALVNSIGLHHSLPTAIADLVDNSLDAAADTIRIRLLLSGGAPIGLQVIDNGNGMDDVGVDRAMTYAGRRNYSDSDLGHFGVGLKAASLSQADTVLIYSRATGSEPVARKLVRGIDGAPPGVGVVAGAIAADRLASAGIGEPPAGGTLIEWRDVRTFPSTRDADEQSRWIAGTIEAIRSHLGLVMHRILARGGAGVSGGDTDAGRHGVALAVDTRDVATGFVGPARTVEPIDPFGYRSVDVAFPQDLVIELPDGSTPVRGAAHLWPAGSQDPGFKIGGDPGGDHQGFFVYRRDRLIQLGGWCGLFAPRRDWSPARVALDLTEAAARHVTINPEKSGLELSADLRRAVEACTLAPSGMTFTQYLDRAAGIDRAARTRQRRPVAVTAPGNGLPGAVIDAYEDAVEMRPDVEPVDIRWRSFMPPDTVFAVDLDHRELQLNAVYRDGIVGQHSLRPDDAPLVKTLLHLLTESYFAGTGGYLGDKAKREIAAFNLLLVAAVRDTQARYAGQTRTGRHAATPEESEEYSED